MKKTDIYINITATSGTRTSGTRYSRLDSFGICASAITNAINQRRMEIAQIEEGILTISQLTNRSPDAVVGCLRIQPPTVKEIRRLRDYAARTGNLWD